jgi:hypothetical protein
MQVGMNATINYKNLNWVVTGTMRGTHSGWDDFDDLDDDPNEGRFEVDEWVREDGSNDRD